MKRLYIFVVTLSLSLLSFAQETSFRSDGTGCYGLYNVRTSRWLSQCVYNDYKRLGSYSGTYYYAVKANNLWGIITERGKVVVSHQFEDVDGFNNGFYSVKKDGSWGLADVSNHLIIRCKYRNIALLPTKCIAYLWDGVNDDEWRMDQLVNMRDRMIKADKERSEQADREKREKAAREKKEKELSSFTEYARAFVEPRINEWQHKGEFEKLANYQKRVTGPNRTSMIDSLTRIAEKNFIDEHAALKPENGYMKLDLYDSENEVFFIESPKLGKMVVPVPISEGPDFKSHFDSLEKKNALFYIVEDKIALASLDFYDKTTGRTYHFSNDNALNYIHYEVDPDAYKFDLVNIVTAKYAEGSVTNTTMAPRRPVITILSPEKNSTYSDPKVTVRYQASVFDGSKPTLHAWVNGIETEVSSESKTASKGVAPDWNEVGFLLPKDKDRPCNIMLSVTDDSGYSSENKTISLKYVGEMPKPNLHLFSVGISEYKSPTLTRLNYASKDAEDIVSTISSSDISMYEQLVSPVVLTDAYATKANIERGLATLTREVAQDDVVMLFFSGHGTQDGEDTYFMSVDANSNEPYTGIDFSFIRKNMNKMKDKKCRIIIFMDTCYSGAMFNSKSNLKSVTFAENDIIGFYSSTDSQTSSEFINDENGLFTKALIEGLKGKARNKDGEITIVGLQKYISDYVNRQTEGKQSPIVENKVGDIILYKVK